MSEQDLTFSEWHERLEYWLLDTYGVELVVPTDTLRSWFETGATITSLVRMLGEAAYGYRVSI